MPKPKTDLKALADDMQTRFNDARREIQELHGYCNRGKDAAEPETDEESTYDSLAALFYAIDTLLETARPMVRQLKWMNEE
jgi:hypothetical protein